MAMIRTLVLTAAAAIVLTACDANAPANNADIADSAVKTPPVEPPTPAAPAPPTMDALVTLEKSAYEAWKSRDAKFWDTFLSDKFVGYGPNGKLDKASATTQYTGADCEIRSFAFSNEQMKPLGNDAALITYKSTVDGACGGQKAPVDRWAASVYVRDGDSWRGAFHAEAPIVDPAAAPAKPADKQHAPEAGEVATAEPDADTNALHAAEKAVWEAWREHDAKKIEALTASDISFINIFGTYLPTKADAVKDWTGNGCNVKSVSVTNPVATMLSPTVGILTFNGGADGTCFGQEVGPIWGTSIYVKDGDAWKWTFGINLPARLEGD